jgi:hypothetical protein
MKLQAQVFGFDSNTEKKKERDKERKKMPFTSHIQQYIECLLSCHLRGVNIRQNQALTPET